METIAEARAFLQDVAAKIGCKLHEESGVEGRRYGLEESTIATPPRVFGAYGAYHVKCDVIQPGEILLEVNQPPHNRLRIRKEGRVSRALGRLGIIADHKTGDEIFDDDFIIDNASREEVANLLTDEVRAALRELEPFILFELTNKEYRCFKQVGDDYDPEHAVRDLDTMIRIVDLTSRR